MFMDISSEIIHSLLPVFLVSVIGTNALSIGLIEGVGEGIALISRVFSGAISDWWGKRKALAVAGYSLGALSKPLFAIAPSAGFVLLARSLDRFGKGVRGAPRDALVGDLTPVQNRGAAYGLRQSLDSFGAFIGPLLAIVLMKVTAGAFRTVFWLAAVPGFIAVGLLIRFVHDPGVPGSKKVNFPIQRRELARLEAGYWVVVAIGILFTIARFSEAFILLRAQDVGLADHLVPAILAVMSLAYALGAFPAGRLSDRIGRPILLGSGLVVLILADVVLAEAASVYQVVLGAVLWGLHMAFTQGILASLVADNSKEDVRGTAFGIFGLVSGIGVFAASVIAGWLWNQVGAPATFLAGGVFSLIALLGLIVFNRIMANKN
jgi:MFS family permease